MDITKRAGELTIDEIEKIVNCVLLLLLLLLLLL